MPVQSADVGYLLCHMAGRQLHRGSRLYLLLCAALPVVLPFIHPSVSDGTAAGTYHFVLPEALVGATAPQSTDTPAPDYTGIALWAYALIAAGIAALYAASYFRIYRRLRQGISGKSAGYRVFSQTGIGPGTISSAVFFPGDQMEEPILRHELAHIRAGHRYDAVLLQLMHIFFWASPATWLIGRELKIVHEFEADAQATGPGGIAAYTNLLLGAAFGTRYINTGHFFFHHPIKRRIIMLQKSGKQIASTRTIAAAAVLTAVLITATLFAQTKHRPATAQSQKVKDSIALMDHIEAYNKKYPHAAQEGVDWVSAPSVPDAAKGDIDQIYTPPVPIAAVGKLLPATTGDYAVLRDGRIVYKFVDEMPAFNGDLARYLSQNLNYPDSARAHGQQGRSVVQFVVNEQGMPVTPVIVRSSGFALLDAEALRAVSGMPAWKPGRQKGAAVSVYFTLPVTFKLD